MRGGRWWGGRRSSATARVSTHANAQARSRRRTVMRQMMVVPSSLEPSSVPSGHTVPSGRQRLVDSSHICSAVQSAYDTGHIASASSPGRTQQQRRWILYFESAALHVESASADCGSHWPLRNDGSKAVALEVPDPKPEHAHALAAPCSAMIAACRTKQSGGASQIVRRIRTKVKLTVNNQLTCTP